MCRSLKGLKFHEAQTSDDVSAIRGSYLAPPTAQVFPLPLMLRAQWSRLLITSKTFGAITDFRFPCCQAVFSDVTLFL